MTAAVEIYTRPGCGYCSAAKSLLTRKKAAFTEFDSGVNPDYRQEMYDGPTDKDGNSLEGKAEVIVGKQRNGPTGIVNLYFHKHYTRFENFTQRATSQ